MCALDKTPVARQQFAEVPTISEFTQTFMARYVIPRNKLSEIDKKRQILDNFIIPMLGHLRLDELERSHVDEVIARMRADGASLKTVNNRMSPLRTMLRYAQTLDILKTLPVVEHFKTRRPEIRFLSVEESKRLLTAAQEYSDVYYAMVIMGLLTGMRIGELRALRWEDLSMRRAVVRVHRSLYGTLNETTKSADGTRTIPLDERVITVLKGLLRLGPFVFCREPKGGVLSYWACNDALERICKDAAVKDCTWHTLRHTFASHLIMLGYPLPTVQALLGHSDISMTMRYVHLAPSHEAGAVSALAKLLTA
jgi:integrase